MHLSDVLKRERCNKKLTLEEVAAQLQISSAQHEEIETGGNGLVNQWGPLLAKIAIRLATPTSRLISSTGRSCDNETGSCGALIRAQRERRGQTTNEMAKNIGLSHEEYLSVEAGESPIEKIGPLLLRFAETIEQPIFNLFCPSGIPIDELAD